MDFLTYFTRHLQTVIADSNYREERVLYSEDSLRAGVWYALDYYHSLQLLKKKKQIAELTAQDAFFHGKAPREAVALKRDKKSPTGYKPFCFVLQKNTPPSTAITKIEE